MRSKTAFSILSLIASAAVAWSCSTTRSLEDGQYRLAKNKVVINGDKKLSPREIDKYIQQKSNSYIVFGWNPFLNLYNISGRDTSKLANRIIRKIGVEPVVYQPSSVQSSVSNISRHMEYLGYYGSDVDSEVTVNGRKVSVTYTVTPGKRYKIGDLTFSVPEGEFKKDFMAIDYLILFLFQVR